MKFIRRLLSRFEEILMMTSLSAIVIVMFIQVVMRYLFKNSLSWSEEISRYFFIWMTFLGMSYGLQTKSHLRIDFFENFFPILRKPFEYIGDIFFVGFSIYMLSPSVGVLQMLWKTYQTSPAMEIPMFFVYLSLLVGFILILIRVAEKYIVRFFFRNKDTEGGRKV